VAPRELQCTGGLIFGYKQGVTSQMTRIAERLGVIARDLADGEWPEVFDDVDEMLETALKPRQSQRRGRRT
jgi:hypothetical protein